jgi:hypothetical protein
MKCRLIFIGIGPSCQIFKATQNFCNLECGCCENLAQYHKETKGCDIRGWTKPIRGSPLS